MLEPIGLQRLFEQLARQPSNDPHDSDVRLVVRARARDACEYCLMPTVSQFQVDHVVPASRWSAFVDRALPIKPTDAELGPDHLDNSAWSCSYCNSYKGSSVMGRIGRRTSRLFRPRRDVWEEHFVLTDHTLLIRGLTEVGQTTVRVLLFNDARPNGPLAARHAAIVAGIYPPSWARGWSI
jgi:hypothetical protein